MYVQYHIKLLYCLLIKAKFVKIYIKYDHTDRD